MEGAGLNPRLFVNVNVNVKVSVYVNRDFHQVERAWRKQGARVG